jgi:hypothetical protein
VVDWSEVKLLYRIRERILPYGIPVVILAMEEKSSPTRTWKWRSERYDSIIAKYVVSKIF